MALLHEPAGGASMNTAQQNPLDIDLMSNNQVGNTMVVG
jgi:hypothetical protein